MELEVKALLKESQLIELKTKIETQFSSFVKSFQSQLNNYFQGDVDSNVLSVLLSPYLSVDQDKQLAKLLSNPKKSVRTREIYNPSTRHSEVLLVVKASVDQGSSDNGNCRIELELPLACELSKIDKILLDSGLSYKSKWKRERETYWIESENLSISIDKNSGYGLVIELEKITEDIEEIENLRSILSELGLEELKTERLEKMFSHYNANWEMYYDSGKTFVIK